jgi:hypothetical protein
LLAGGKTASNQIEHMNRYGSALPVLPEEEVFILFYIYLF